MEFPFKHPFPGHRSTQPRRSGRGCSAGCRRSAPGCANGVPVSGRGVTPSQTPGSSVTRGQRLRGSRANLRSNGHEASPLVPRSSHAPPRLPPSAPGSELPPPARPRRPPVPPGAAPHPGPEGSALSPPRCRPYLLLALRAGGTQLRGAGSDTAGSPGGGHSAHPAPARPRPGQGPVAALPFPALRRRDRDRGRDRDQNRDRDRDQHQPESGRDSAQPSPSATILFLTYLTHLSLPGQVRAVSRPDGGGKGRSFVPCHMASSSSCCTTRRGQRGSGRRSAAKPGTARRSHIPHRVSPRAGCPVPRSHPQ